ncbi:hypothetical protein BT96DRAFT_1019605 [Gymnopus androsaceus JB14]|uniref:FAR-17a/AIG1-like protein n=1 Tax=Gymnopus androsaceus JB14 TaxID=1447944 RepID=A0A6A4HQI6_9AGAR|nr:hypothetical protein BT96DRAFT_1019605 [Gymnopus androsaceus JB14]
MPPLARILLHSSASAIMIYGYKSLQSLPVNDFIEQQYGGHLQYLTIQGLFIACAAMTFSLLKDLFPSATVLGPLKRILLIVSYASLDCHFDGEPSSSSDSPQFIRIPLRTDISLHAVPAITLLADFLLFERKYTKNEVLYGAPAVSLGYSALYAWWVEHCATFNNGRFPYPFLTDNPPEIRLAIYVGAGTLALSSFWLINRLHA